MLVLPGVWAAFSSGEVIALWGAEKNWKEGHGLTLERKCPVEKRSSCPSFRLPALLLEGNTFVLGLGSWENAGTPAALNFQQLCSSAWNRNRFCRDSPPVDHGPGRQWQSITLAYSVMESVTLYLQLRGVPREGCNTYRLWYPYVLNVQAVHSNAFRFMTMDPFIQGDYGELSQKYVSICPEQFDVICGVSEEQVPRFTFAVENSGRSVYQGSVSPNVNIGVTVA